MSDEEVQDLLTSIRKQKAEVANAHEVAALLESFGCNDPFARDKGFPTIFSLAENLFGRLQQDTTSEKEVPQNDRRFVVWAEIKCAMRKCSFSMGYSIPWMAMLALEYWRPDALRVSPELGGALSLSLIASLITTGGFVQMISRSGNFYYGLKEPALARHSSMSLLSLGLTSTFVLALLAMMLGSYFHLFTGNYLVLAATNYVALSLLWMFCAVLSVQGIGWCIPCVFVCSALISGLFHSLAGWSGSTLAMLWPWTATLCALGCVLTGFHREEKKHADELDSARPRLGVMFISLIPFYVYGTTYFGFLFGDRVTAGSAIPWVSGLSFGIDADYKKSMDLVLLAFLITAALVEYLADSFLRFWQRLATKLPQGASEQLAAGLRRRHAQMMKVIFAAFVVTSVGAWFTFSRSGSLAVTPRMFETAVLGGFGYLMLSIALLEAIILASMNAISMAVAALALGVGVNLLAGYGLSHLWGVEYAAVGLLLGSAVVLFKCNAAVRQMLSNPSYHYSIS
jgi:hypothetical protein